MTLIYEPEGCQKVMFLEFWIAIDIIMSYILTLRLSSWTQQNNRSAFCNDGDREYLSFICSFKNKVYKKHMFNDTVDQKWFYNVIDGT